MNNILNNHKTCKLINKVKNLIRIKLATRESTSH